jgi:23S rRNA U2552 (ribose-2'-O)-methylase RlmE/FtsJ
MQTLTEIFNEIGHFGNDIGCNDKNSTHTYTETYDKLFSTLRNGCTFMEIGLALGDSIKLFDKYFENSKIVGVDISVVFTPEEYRNDVKIIEADATKQSFLEHIKDYTFDVIIDDGSHMGNDQVATFELLKHKMNPGGIYIIEDILAIDQNRNRFNRLHDNCEIIDMRHNGRFDNVLIIYRF